MKTDRKKLVEKCVALAKDIAKKRDNYTDQRSGEKLEKNNCHGSHVIPTSVSKRLSWDPMNIKVLSFHNHINWWHKHPLESGQWFRDKFPERMQYLEEREHQNGPIKMYEIEEAYERLRDEWELMK